METINNTILTAIQTTQIAEKKRVAPANLIISSKLSRNEKMAIFEARQKKILRFLIEENYSSLENLAKLINTPKSTISRITKHLCDKDYLVRTNINIGLARDISIYQPTNTGIMFAIEDGENMPELREVSKVNATTIYHDLQLQKIRLKLEADGYSNFQSSWQLTKILRKRQEKAPKIPDYTCIDPDGNKIAIEYERTIKTTKRYREIIGQYMDIRDRNIIKEVLCFTDEGFANKLKHMFMSIDYIYRNGKTEKCDKEQLNYFKFSHKYYNII